MSGLRDMANRHLNNLYNMPYASSALALFFILYASLVAPDLPPYISNLFSNQVFKIIVMIVILSFRKYDPVLSLLVSVAFVISLQTMHRHKCFDKLRDWKSRLKKV